MRKRLLVRLTAPLALAAVAGIATAADGSAVFAGNCAMCHQSDARGLPGQYPRLRGRVAKIGSRPEGRRYLIDIVTYGMAGSIVVDDQPIIGVMPQLQLSDEEAASVLSYVQGVGGGRTAAFTTAEVAAQRAQPIKTGADVLAERRLLQGITSLE